jgi:lactate dehydrogenase-like 2-hydroxyacid dehydrogenase
MSKSGIFAIENEHPLYLRMPPAHDIMCVCPKMSDAQDDQKLPQNIVGIASIWNSYVPPALISQFPLLIKMAVVEIGYDGADVAAAKKRRVPISNKYAVFAERADDLVFANFSAGVAEQTLLTPVRQMSAA